MKMHGKRAARVGSVAAAVGLTVAVWVLAEPVLGFDVRGPARSAGGVTSEVNGVVIAVVALVASLAGWALLSVLERLTPRRARNIWVAVAVGVLVLSLGGPLGGAGITAANKLWLAAMHLSVGAVLIPSLARTSRVRTHTAAYADSAPGHVADAAPAGPGGESR